MTRKSDTAARARSRARKAAPTPLANLRARLGLPRPVFSRLLGFSERAVADWESGKKEPSAAAARQVEQLRRLHAQLARLMDADAIGPWLVAPNEMLGGLKPIEVVERGEGDRLWHLLYLLESGTPI